MKIQQLAPDTFPAWASGRSRIMILLPLAVVAVAACWAASVAWASSPYPASPIVGGISWNESTKLRYASGSDIWDSTWASDGNVYSVWGDGNGFSSPSKVQIGVSKLAGTPASPPVTGTDVYYGSPSPPPGCTQLTTIGGKPNGVVALPSSTMYMFHSTEDLCTNNSWLAKSTNNGTSWTDHVNSLQWPDSHGFRPSTFLQYGQSQAGGLIPDTSGTQYLYIYAGNSNDAAGSGKQYLARAPASPANSIETLSNWSYFSGLDGSGNPTWASSSASAVPVWTDSDHAESLTVTFDKAIGRYIAYNDHGTGCGSPCERQVALYDAPSPWGPWTNFDYEDNFDNTGCGSNCLGNLPAVGFSMMQKWFGTDGLSIWPAYSSTGVWDSLNFIKGTMALATGSTVTTLAPVTGAPYVLDKLSLSNPGNLDYIDRTFRFTSIPAAYLGKEQIRLANSDKGSTASNYLTFTITTGENVCVGWDTRATVPTWLSTWTSTGNTLTDSASVTFAVYRKSFSAGTVTLGGANTIYSNYVVFVGC